MNMNHQPYLFEQSTGKVMFGDSGEFEFERIAEHIDAETGVIEELTLFFVADGRNFGLSIEISDLERVREADPIDDIPPAIETRYIDPRVVLQALGMPSEAIRTLAIPADLEE